MGSTSGCPLYSPDTRYPFAYCSHPAKPMARDNRDAQIDNRAVSGGSAGLGAGAAAGGAGEPGDDGDGDDAER